MKIVTPVLVKAYENRMMNIHPSLLPSFPGLDAQKQALEHGVKISGCTVHFVTEGVDEGPIVIQAAVPVQEGDTPETLAARILIEEHNIYPKAVQLYAEGRLKVEGRIVRVSGASG
jgi:phosphoribosylglycinamide formyltransferase-1